MADDGGLRQSGCAGGVDIERAILDRRRAALTIAQRFARVSLDLAIDSRELVGARAVGPDSCRAREVGQRRSQPIDELSGHDDVLRRDDIDAMRE